MPGTALGWVFWSFADPDMIRLVIGTIALGFIAFQAGRRLDLIRLGRRPVSPVVGLAAGTGAGFTSFVSHADGPLAAVYLLSRVLTKTEYQATTVLVFGITNAFKVVPYALLGMLSADILGAVLWLTPAALFGAWIGVKAHRAIPERAFFAVTYVLLAVAGGKLVWDALT